MRRSIRAMSRRIRSMALGWRVLGAGALLSIGSILAWIAIGGGSAPGPKGTSEMEAGPGQSTAPTPATFTSIGREDVTTLTGDVQRPNGMVWSAGDLFVSCSGDGTIYQIDAETGFTAAYRHGVADAHDLVAEPLDEGVALWVPDFEEDRVKRVTRDGVATVATGLAGAWGIASAPDGWFVVSSQRAGTLHSVHRDGRQSVIVEGLSEPAGVAVDLEAGVAYVANAGDPDRAVESYQLDASGEAQLAADAELVVAGLERPAGLELTDDGWLYVAYQIEDRGYVGRVDPERCRARDGGCGAGDAHPVLDGFLAAPLAGLTISDAGRLRVHTAYGPKLYGAPIR